MLLILGNGFDLRCGLESDYISFFKERYKNGIFQSFEKILKSSSNRINMTSVDDFDNDYNYLIYKHLQAMRLLGWYIGCYIGSI